MARARWVWFGYRFTTVCLVLELYTVSTLIIARPKMLQFTTLRGTGEKTCKYLQDQLNENDTLLMVQRVVLVGTSVDSFIENLSTFITSICFSAFYEQVLTIPGNSVLLDLTVRKALQLKSISVNPNATLQSLTVEGCDFRSILTTVVNCTQLLRLTVEGCGITHLNLELFAKNRLLELLNLNGNRIATISRFASLNITIKMLYLDKNPLQYMDLHSLVNLQHLQYLSIRNCNLVRLYTSVPLTLSALENLIVGNNILNTVNLVLLEAPSLEDLDLSKNRIRKVPLDLAKFTRLKYLNLNHNELCTLDLADLAGFNRLQSFLVSSNQLKSFTASRTVKLPKLHTLALGRNLLETIDTYHRWNFPSLERILMEDNRFTAVPLLQKRWPKMALKMSNNPLMCSSLEGFVEQILYRHTLIVDFVKCAKGSEGRSDLIKRNCCILKQQNEARL